MKIIPTLLTLLVVAAPRHVQAEREDLEASAGEALVLTPTVEASYDIIDDKCTHPVLQSAASFSSNFFCENVLKVAVKDIACERLQFQVILATAQIVSGANFRETIVIVDESGECVVAFKSKVFMPLPHQGLEPEVDMNELSAIGCAEVEFESVCLKSLGAIDAYWEEDIENGGGTEPINSLAEEEKVQEEEEEMIEVVEEDLAEESNVISTGEGGATEPVSNNIDTNGMPTAKNDTPDNSTPAANSTQTGEVKEEKVNSTPATNSTPAEVSSTETSEVKEAPSATNSTPEQANSTQTGEVKEAPDNSTPAINSTPAQANSTQTGEVEKEGTPESDKEPLVVAESLGLDSAQPEEKAPVDPMMNTLSSFFGLDPSSNSTTAEAVGEALVAEEEVLEGLETELEEEILDLAEEVEAEEEIQEEVEEEQKAAWLELDEDDFDDESTWAFAGKTDECSRFGESPAEGIAFKCGETVYLCGEAQSFREKFLLLLEDPIVDGCNLGRVSDIFSSRKDCNYFPKNEHYLGRDGKAKDGHHLYCPNGHILNSYYMFCTEELDNYYCDGAECETCEVTGRKKGRFLRH